MDGGAQMSLDARMRLLWAWLRAEVPALIEKALC